MHHLKILKSLITREKEELILRVWKESSSFVAMRDGEWAFGALYCSINSFTSSFTVCQGSQPKNSSSPKFMVCHYQMPKTYIKIFHHLFFFEDVSLKFEEIDLVKAGNVWVCCAFGNAFLDRYPHPQYKHSRPGCSVSINTSCNRPWAPQSCHHTACTKVYLQFGKSQPSSLF